MVLFSIQNLVLSAEEVVSMQLGVITGWKLYPYNNPRKGGRIRYFHSPSSFRSLIDFSIVHFDDMSLSRVALHSLHLVENKWWNKWWNKWCVRCWDLLLDLSQVQYCEWHLKPKYHTTEVCERVISSISRFTCAQECLWALRQTNNWSPSLLRSPFTLVLPANALLGMVSDGHMMVRKCPC